MTTPATDYTPLFDNNDDDTTPLATAVQVETANVVAPVDLPAGYDLQILYQGDPAIVKVPSTGVVKGQAFEAPVLRIGETLREYNDELEQEADIPVGVWRDSTRDWCTLALMTAVCLPLSLAQVMTRMRLDACASPSRDRVSTFKVMLAIVIVYQLVLSMLSAVTPSSHKHSGDKEQDDDTIWNHAHSSWARVSMLLGAAFGVYIFLLLWRTRKYIRRRYHIQPEVCVCCEDAVCAFCCPWYAVVQMSRHTGDFRRQRASCCTETGLKDRSMIHVV